MLEIIKKGKLRGPFGEEGGDKRSFKVQMGESYRYRESSIQKENKLSPKGFCHKGVRKEWQGVCPGRWVFRQKKKMDAVGP